MESRFERFTVLISKLGKYIKRIKAEEVSAMGLKGPHVYCIYYLYTCESLTAKELGMLCEEDKASVSRTLDFLESNGYVTYTKGDTKRYKVKVLLTEKGKEIGAKIMKKVERVLELSSQGLTEKERLTMYKSLGVIARNLEKLCEEYQ